jgi:hypothetical protein
MRYPERKGGEVKMKTMIVLASVLAIGAIGVRPVAAATAKHRRHTATCQQIKDAISSGKSAEDVQKDMHVSEARVKQCTAPAAAAHKAAPAAPAASEPATK